MGEDNGKPADSSVEVSLGGDFDGPFPDSNALAQALASSASVRTCFARQLFRASAGYSGELGAPSEQTFLDAWSAVPAAAQGDIIETLITYVKTSVFSHRRVD
jgi:hypothetical protein